MIKYSIVVPVYNRIDEVLELIQSLLQHDEECFELILVDGSPENVLVKVDEFVNYKTKHFDYKRIHKPQLGISSSRNLGAREASGEYLLFFDSDVLVPENYFVIVEQVLDKESYDLFGGPDAAHKSFSITQKAINYCMTSILTTGGIRGAKTRVGKFRPRGFNLGIRKSVFEAIGGYDESMKVSEDVDLSAKVIAQGFSVGLIPDAFVYHKRRLSLKRFYRQVFRFGAGRILLARRYSDELKITHLFPLLFVLFIFLGPFLIFIDQMLFEVWFCAVLFYFLSNFVMATVQNRSLKVGLLVVPTLLIQFLAYSFGFIKNWCHVFILKKEDGFFTDKKSGPESPL